MLDTNICIYLMDEAPESVVKRFARCELGEVLLSSITWAELCCGMGEYNSQYEMMALFSKLSSVNFDMSAAEVFGSLSREFPGRKNSFDRMIAAHAISLNSTLVTNNTTDFVAYQSAGLMLENWT